MSINSLEVDLAGVFEYGQSYVALSRARTLEGLVIKNLNPNKIMCNDEYNIYYNE